MTKDKIEAEAHDAILHLYHDMNVGKHVLGRSQPSFREIAKAVAERLAPQLAAP